MRLDKYLSDLGLASRKELKQMIKSGRVTLNGAAAQPESRVEPDRDCVSLDGKELLWNRFRYFMMDKPCGVLTAAEDKKQMTVVDLLPAEIKRLGLFPVGRLDKDTSGLLLLTNDGEYAHQVISPKHHVNKIYYARTEGSVTVEDEAAFHNGIILRDDLHCMPAELIRLSDDSCLVTVQEGKYHQVRRMLASRGKPVLELRRLSIGSLRLAEDSTPGRLLELTQEQKDLVFQNAAGEKDMIRL